MYQRIQYFLKSAEAKSFSVAARELYLSPQALTKQIGLLERELGGRLFERSRRGVRLTEFGEYALEKLKGAYKALDEAVSEVRDYAAGGKEQISIGIFSALPRETLVLPLVSFLLSGYPDCQFTLEMIELGEGLRKFLSGKLDFLLTNAHEEDDLSGYARLSFGVYDARVVVSLVHPWAIRDSVTAADLAAENFIKMKMDMDHYTVPAESSFYNNVPCKRVVDASNFETMMVLLGQAAGFAVFPLAFTNMEQSRIKSFPYPGKPIRFSTSLFYDPRRRGGILAKIAGDLSERFDLVQL